MSSSLLFVILAQAVFAVILGTVGVRLLLLASRTRCAPELALGVGFIGMVAAILLLALSGIERGVVADIRFPLLAIALFLLWVAHSSMCCFTWRAFRPAETWAAALTGVISASVGSIVIGVWHGVTTADPTVSTLAATSPWLLWVRFPFMVGLIWTGVEAFRQYGMARRRLAMGIGDSVVANRFLLWGLVSVFILIDNCAGAVLQAQGRGPGSDPLSAMILALDGIIGGGLVYLIFMPPQAWLRFVRARAAA